MPDIILLSDPRVAAVPVAECDEPLVDLRTVTRLRVDERQADGTGAFAHLRAGAVERLLAAQERLPAGVRFLVVEGYRPPSLQRRYFEQYLGTLRQARPGEPPERLRALASAYISPPEVAPHVTGGAVDLTLCTEEGEELPLGTEVNATPEESGGACRTAAPTSPEARRNRALMDEALGAQGFVNYPTEWWHWSFGDRYWALLGQEPAAAYGPVSDGG
ncbi:M15 family metallopeptidase [Streptomyces sp. TRM 70351]|uniref:M15 family metallopeptidase n=1 Tax=Streptomyces sp. TRM 70351 TaxID=3116552 RepID=UPI002E7B549B|nr:M15 family metallopeptidase [Streptomyces sp. TRM 70351]MEE1927525.1 M15 family metallopeptidase [Streptomyces sp. TRM 70351]